VKVQQHSHDPNQPTELAAGRLVKLYQPITYAPWWDSIGAFRLLAGKQAMCPSTLKEAYMSWVRRIRTIDRDQVIAGISQVREEWEIAAGDIVHAHASVGMLLADLVSAIGLPPEDQVQALGGKLFEATKQ
jgi:hypothetical protein